MRNKGSKKDFVFFLYVPTFYLSITILMSFSMIVHGMLGDARLSVSVALAILFALIYLLRKYVLNALKGLDKGDGYYVADDYVVGYKRPERPFHGFKVLNACVPVVPGLGAIIVSRSLVGTLNNGELRAVVKHEEGHVYYNHPLFYTVSFAIFFFTYHMIFKVINAYLGPAYNIVFALEVPLAFAIVLLFINTVGRSLEREADHYVVINGYSTEFRSALSKIPSKTRLLARLFDPHPIYYARPSALGYFDRLSWHIKVISPHILLLSISFTAYLTMRLVNHIGSVSPVVIAPLIPALIFTAFLIAAFVAYVLMYIHNALGIEPWESRIIILTYYLGTLLAVFLELGLEGFVASMIASPLVLYYRNLRKYLIALTPFLLTTALNFAAVVIIYGLLQS